jgi:DNA-binding MarR family transcriptional regulator
VIVYLTDAGRRTREKVIALREGHLTQALAGWRAADVAAFARMLDQFVIDLQATPLVPNEAPA